MAGSVLSPVVDDGVMSESGPRAGGPRPRRTFTPAEKLRHPAAYEAACQDGLGGGYLRREGLYSSQITEWRKLRDGGLLQGREPGEDWAAQCRAGRDRPVAGPADQARAAA